MNKNWHLQGTLCSSLILFCRCLQSVIEGCGKAFNEHITQNLLDLIFQALNHTNRFVRETGYQLCGSLVRVGRPEGTNNPFFFFIFIFSYSCSQNQFIQLNKYAKTVGKLSNYRQNGIIRKVIQMGFFQRGYYIKMRFQVHCLHVALWNFLNLREKFHLSIAISVLYSFSTWSPFYVTKRPS